MIVELGFEVADVAATCRLLVERYHRAFEEELPRLESLGWKVAHSSDNGAPFARALMHALLSLKDEILRHTAVAEATVHPFAGSVDGDVLLAEHIRDHHTIKTLIEEALAVVASAPAPTRLARVLADGLHTLGRNLDMFFALEARLASSGGVVIEPPAVPEAAGSAA